MASDKRSVDKPSMTIKEDRPVTPKKKSVGSLTVDIDCSETLKGIKAIQRTAKKATAALKELDNIKKSTCPKCKTISLDISTLYSGSEVFAINKTCTNCGWDNSEGDETDSKYLVIELDELGNVPRVFHNGEEISNKNKVEFSWNTADEKYPSEQVISIDYYNVDDLGNSERSGIHVSKGLRNNSDKTKGEI